MLSKNHRFTFTAANFKKSTNMAFKNAYSQREIPKFNTEDFLPLIIGRLNILEGALNSKEGLTTNNQIENPLSSSIEHVIQTINKLTNKLQQAELKGVEQSPKNLLQLLNIEDSEFKPILKQLGNLKQLLSVISQQRAIIIKVIQEQIESVRKQLTNLNKLSIERLTKKALQNGLLQETNRGVKINGKQCYFDDIDLYYQFLLSEFNNDHTIITALARFSGQDLQMFCGPTYNRCVDPNSDHKFINPEEPIRDGNSSLEAQLFKAKNAYFENRNIHFYTDSPTKESSIKKTGYKTFIGALPKAKNVKPNIFIKDGEVYFQTQLTRIQIKDPIEDKRFDGPELLGPNESVFKLNKKKGFDLGLVGTDSETNAKMIMGYRLDDNEYIKFDRTYEKDGVIWRPAPLSFRLKTAFQNIYNPNFNRSNSEAFFGQPDWNNKYNVVEWLSPAGGFFGTLTTLKNFFVTFPCEMIPAFIEQAGSWIMDHAKTYFDKQKAATNTDPRIELCDEVAKLKPYDVASMTRDELKKINVIEIKCDKLKGLEYRVIGLDNQEKKGVITWDQLPGFPREDKEILDNKNKLLPQILNITAKKGHTESKFTQFFKTAFFKIAAYGGLVLGGLLFGIGNAIGFVGRRVSSPLQSAKDSYEYGLRKGGKPLAVAATVGSALMTGTAYAGIAFGAAALVVASPVLVGVAALKLAATTILSSGPVIVAAVATAVTSFNMAAKALGKWLGSKNNKELKTTSALVKKPDVASRESKRMSPQSKGLSNNQIDNKMKRNGTAPITISKGGEPKDSTRATRIPPTPIIEEGSFEGSPEVEYSPSTDPNTNPAHLKIMNYPKTANMEKPTSPKGEELTEDNSLSISPASDDDLNNSEYKKPRIS